MPRFRATVWVLTGLVAAVEGDAGLSRRIVELEAENERMFEAHIRDRYIHDQDAEICFGPISKKD